MREEDFREVVHAIQRQLQLAGVPEIGAIENYQLEDERRIGSKDLAIQMLKAFELHLATLDGATYKKSITKVRATLPRRRGPSNAVIAIGEEAGSLTGAPTVVELSQLPRLTRLRKSVRRLASDLAEEPYEGPRLSGLRQ